MVSGYGAPFRHGLAQYRFVMFSLWPFGYAPPQFFITLDKADWLNNRNTIFGRVVGDTVYNMLRFNDLPVRQQRSGLGWLGWLGRWWRETRFLCACVKGRSSRPLLQAPAPLHRHLRSVRCCGLRQVDDSDRPLEPPVIREAEVVWNPFDDMVPRVDREAIKADKEAAR